MKAKILTNGLNLNGKELKKGTIEDLPWQIVNNWSIRGWVKPVEDGEKDGLQTKADSTSGGGTGKHGGSKTGSKGK